MSKWPSFPFRKHHVRKARTAFQRKRSFTASVLFVKALWGVKDTKMSPRSTDLRGTCPSNFSKPLQRLRLHFTSQSPQVIFLLLGDAASFSSDRASRRFLVPLETGVLRLRTCVLVPPTFYFSSLGAATGLAFRLAVFCCAVGSVDLGGKVQGIRPWKMW